METATPLRLPRPSLSAPRNGKHGKPVIPLARLQSRLDNPLSAKQRCRLLEKWREFQVQFRPQQSLFRNQS